MTLIQALEKFLTPQQANEALTLTKLHLEHNMAQQRWGENDYKQIALILDNEHLP